MLVVVAAFVRLGVWQFERSGITGQERAEAERVERLATPAVPIEEMLAPQSPMTADLLGRQAIAVGEFSEDEQVLVRHRSVEGEPAVLVVSALRLTEGEHAGAVLPVLRGWFPEEELTSLEVTPEAPVPSLEPPAVPEGVIEVVGYLAASEATDPAAWPHGQTGAISSAELVNLWGAPIFDAYLVAHSPEQPEGLRAAPPPGIDVGNERDPRNLAYAIEWWIFAVFAVAFWFKVWRDDVAELRGEAAEPGEDEAR